MKETSTTFLKLTPKEEDKNGVPFCSYLKLEAEHASKKGGVAVLKLLVEGAEVGSVTIDWQEPESRRRPRGRNYFVSKKAKVDQVDTINMPAWKRSELIIEAVKNAGWTIFGYNIEDHPDVIDAVFEQWIQKNL